MKIITRTLLLPRDKTPSGLHSARYRSMNLAPWELPVIVFFFPRHIDICPGEVHILIEETKRKRNVKSDPRAEGGGVVLWSYQSLGRNVPFRGRAIFRGKAELGAAGHWLEQR